MYINEKELKSCYDYSNIENQNANVDELSFNGMTGKMADMVASKDALENYVSETTRRNHESNRIYIHDRSAYTTGQHNCINLPFDDLLNKVIRFRQTNTRPASRLSSAGQLIAIFFQAQSNMQFGGCGATHIDTTLVPYYRLSFYKHYKTAMKYFYGSVVANLSREDIMNLSVIDDFYSDDKAYQYAHDETEEELKQTIESLMHNLNSLMSRASNQLPFTSINYGIDTTVEGRRIIRAILNETIKGSGDKGLTYIFPCQIFQCDKDINLYPNTPNYDLFQLALQCSGKRLYPNYANCNWSAESDKHDNKPENRMSTMGCRTYIGYDINGLGWLKDGRGNAFPTTIILPTIAMETLEEAQGLPQQAVIEVFMRKFSMVINDAKNSLIERYNYACSRKPESASFMYENNVIAGYDGKTIRSAMKHMTLGIGILGLAECLQILIGTNQTTKEGMKLAKRICKFHFDKCLEYKDRYSLNFSSYYTPKTI